MGRFPFDQRVRALHVRLLGRRRGQRAATARRQSRRSPGQRRRRPPLRWEPRCRARCSRLWCSRTPPTVVGATKRPAGQPQHRNSEARPPQRPGYGATAGWRQPGPRAGRDWRASEPRQDAAGGQETRPRGPTGQRNDGEAGGQADGRQPRDDPAVVDVRRGGAAARRRWNRSTDRVRAGGQLPIQQQAQRTARLLNSALQTRSTGHLCGLPPAPRTRRLRPVSRHHTRTPPRSAEACNRHGPRTTECPPHGPSEGAQRNRVPPHSSCPGRTRRGTARRPAGLVTRQGPRPP